MKRKMPKSYTTGMIVLLFLCAMYIVVYPQFQKQELEQSAQIEESAGESGIVDEFTEDAGESGIVDEFTEDAGESGIVDEFTEDEEEIMTADEPTEEEVTDEASQGVYYEFRSNQKYLDHYQKHGIEMGFSSPEEYLDAANALINNPDALHKYEEEDGDDVYYLESTDEIAFVSQDGYLRTYFICSGKSYFDRQ